MSRSCAVACSLIAWLAVVVSVVGWCLPATADRPAVRAVCLRVSALDRETFAAMGGVRLERALLARLVQDGFAVVHDDAAAEFSLALEAASPTRLRLVATSRAGRLVDTLDRGSDEATFVFEVAQRASLLIGQLLAATPMAPLGAGPATDAGAPTTATRPQLRAYTPADWQPTYFAADRRPRRKLAPPGDLRVDAEVGTYVSKQGVAPGLGAGGSVAGDRGVGVALQGLLWWAHDDAYRVTHLQVGAGPLVRMGNAKLNGSLGASLGVRYHKFVLDDGIAIADGSRVTERWRFAGAVPLVMRYAISRRLGLQAAASLLWVSTAQSHVWGNGETWRDGTLAGQVALGASWRR